ncbi:WecB/TagA/CpsF family glycosyltransferase [Patescibacteria group bacterium]|nr:WecB/TagA/CpsF family glycosyltransferase [Patescibacteria group bacterium]
MKTLRIFNQRVDSLSFKECFKLVKLAVSSKEKKLFFALNIHILNLLSKDKTFKNKHEKMASVIFSDGLPLVLLSKFKSISKEKIIERVSGTDLVEKILKDKSLKVFILGSDEETLEVLQKKYKNITGFYSPPYSNNWSNKENVKIIEKIKVSKANVLLIGVGPLKQEKWLLKYFDQIKNLYVGIGVGSAFDIISGKTPRAPKLFRNFSLEWLWRLILEPRRLFRRYFNDSKFLFKLLFHY